MKSPAGSHPAMQQTTLEDGLVVWQCPESGGHWIPAQNYWRWRSTTGRQEPEPPTTPAEPLTVSESDDAVKLCPESGTIMTRYQVGHGQPFRLDRSATGGVWLDAGEWQALKAGNLHRELHRIFTAPWQKAVRDQAQQEHLANLLRERLGPDLHTRLCTLREDLAGHPHRAAALAFLHDS